MNSFARHGFFLAALLLLMGMARMSCFSSHGSSTWRDLVASRQIASAYTPDQIATAYGFTPLYDRNVDGSGQTIALLEIDRYVPSDLATFDASYDLAAPSVTEYFSGGHQFSLSSNGESALDVEWVHALAPGAAIQIYYVDGQSSLYTGWLSMARALHAAGANGAGIVSISLGACRPGRGASAVNAELQRLFQLHISVFVSSGDDGDHAGPVQDCGSNVSVAYPGSDPFVASVGGTSLLLHSDNTIAREVAWKGSGGGQSLTLLRRPWQHAITMQNNQQRWTPDISFLGNPNTGVSYYHRGTWRRAGGTSLGAPAWAAAWALIEQSAQAAGKAPRPAVKLLYRIGNSTAYTSVLHDITTGSNGIYRAGIAWDPVTGWGTPDVSALAALVTAWSPKR